MRFGKRKNTLAALGRRLFGKQQEKPTENPLRDEGVVREERDALLDSGFYQDSQSANFQDAEPSTGIFTPIDPIQRLWIKLGHFSRQLSRAQDGTDAAGWDEQAMTDLAESLEIALNNDMPMICTPLIDVGRVLASYRAAGKPTQCLSFLLEAYDQLSMIAGDVVVGSVSEAVQRRWEELYDAQVRRMQEEGIPLIEDDEDDEEGGDNQGPAICSNAVPDPDVMTGTAEDRTGRPIDVPGCFGTLELEISAARPETRAEQEPFEEVDQAMEQMADPDGDIMEQLPPPPPDESILSSSGWQSVISEITQPQAEHNPPIPAETSVPSDFSPADGDLTVHQEPVPSPETVSEDRDSALSPGHPAAMSEQAADPEPQVQLQASPERDKTAASDNLLSFPPAARPYPPEAEETIPLAEPTEAGRAEEPVDQISPDRDAETFPTAETEAPVPENLAGEDKTMLPAESGELIHAVEQPSVTDPETVEASSLPGTLSAIQKEAAAAVQQGEDPVDAINRSMQQAILDGNIAEARVLAIRLAAALARREVEHADQTIAETTLELENNQARIEEACRREQEAQERVARVEAQIVERRGDQAANRQQLMEIDSNSQSHKARIEELEAQIRRLQELRANELDKLRDKELERESVLARDSLLDAELSALDAEEEAARDFLSDARDRLSHLRTEREKLETRLKEWQQERDRRARHVEEIEAPLLPRISPGDAGEPSDPAGQNDQPLLC